MVTDCDSFGVGGGAVSFSVVFFIRSFLFDPVKDPSESLTCMLSHTNNASFLAAPDSVESGG